MKPLLQSILSFASMLTAALSLAAKSDLTTSDQRHESVSQAVALAQPRVAPPLPTDVRNPFAPPEVVRPKNTGRPVPAADKEVLTAIVNNIRPSGVMQAPDGQLILLMREKKLKVGDYLTITFEGRDYVIELAAIDHSSFTLRLNKEKITQPINP